MKCEQQIHLLETTYEDLESKHDSTKSRIRSKVQEEVKDMCDEIKKMMHHGHILIEEKAHLIHGFKDEL